MAEEDVRYFFFTFSRLFWAFESFRFLFAMFSLNRCDEERKGHMKC